MTTLNCTVIDCILEDILCNCSSPNKGPDTRYLIFRDQSRFWVQRVLVPIITIIGVIGNSVTIFVMSQRRMRSSTNHYLAALGVADMLYLVFSFILSLSHYPNFHDVEYYGYWKLRPFLFMLTDTCSNTSVWLTVTFTVERYIAVCHPMRGKVYCTESRAKKAILGVLLICMMLTLPTPFEYKIDDSKLPSLDLTYSDLGRNALYQTIFYWLTSILFIFLPLLLLTIFNLFLIHSLHTSKMRRETMTRRNDAKDTCRQERKITIMLVSVVILFIVCQLPTAMVLIYQIFNDVEPNSNQQTVIESLGNFFNFLVAINAAGNFVLYCLFSQKFRNTFVQSCCPCLKGKIYHLHSVYQNTLYTSAYPDSPQVSHKILDGNSGKKEKNGKLLPDHESTLREYPNCQNIRISPQAFICSQVLPYDRDCTV